MSALNPAGLLAVFRRQLGSLLGNPLAYVFILAFVLFSGAYLFLLAGDNGDAFFTRNIADLGLLQPVMPWALAVLLPALAMGAWASERESGTEELLLTLPLSPLDALLGKYLAIVAYFTIALACSAARDAFVLGWLGNPDLGLFLANYLGWWLGGLVFAAFGLFASVLVAMPAIAFVLGAVFCAVVMWLAGLGGWFDDFNRGVVTLGGVVIAMAAAGVGVAASLAIIASRRWRPASEATAVAHVLSLLFAIAIAVNLSHIGRRLGIDADITAERLSSISSQSGKILANVDQPVVIAAFVSEDLPPELLAKAKELDDKLNALARASAGRIEIRRYYPQDEFDEQGQLATREYGLKPHDQMTEGEAGRESMKVFLGAAVTSGGKSQVIEYFDPGLSVEYELVRAVRTVGSAKKHVLGIATTDVEMYGGFDFRAGNMNPAWQTVEEWKRQYDVREVNLDSSVASDIEVLVVPQPSSLTEAQIKNLHHFIWSGGPTVLLEDPMPYFAGIQFAASQPKKGGGGQFGQPPEGPKKGDIKPLFRALGLDFDVNRVVWSQYNPSHTFRGAIPPNFVWARSDQRGSVSQESDITTGLTALFFPFPGAINVADEKPATINVKVLAKPVPSGRWGSHGFTEHVSSNMFGQPQQQKVNFDRAGSAVSIPALAVEITGRMPSAFPEADPSARTEEPKDPAAPDADQAGPPKPVEKVGVPSAKDIHVVAIADLDFAHDLFFQFYRNQDDQLSKDERRFLLDIRNVQFMANVVDALAGDQDFLALRRQRAQPRPLQKLEDLRLVTESKKHEQEEKALAEFEKAKEQAQNDMNDKLRKISEREDVDEGAKADLVEHARQAEQRKFDQQVAAIQTKKDKEDNKAKADQRRTIAQERRVVRWLVLFIPSAILATLVAFVFVQRLARERSHIPASRKRSNP
jgi:ABC-2 type transport system permease protein